MGKKRKTDSDILVSQLLTRSEFLDVALSAMGIDEEPKTECEAGSPEGNPLMPEAPARKFRSRPPGL